MTGGEVEIDVAKDDNQDSIKRKLAKITGIPIEHQKIRLAGINQMFLGDKRSNLKFSACGSTTSEDGPLIA
eukprot:CAMPEP_0197857112 /NCGR_PEP_ID=MMETSP1438-20131217/29893_1 /TAXON_ID=1461541 /ORGANISM="Pterosperma sp., Strain CCMP1384" /LENGTH=70 /DNA_ID=CAMNT_0043472821 /DNA_START=393 /DNA_END=605 /DNA_ORIENTATION=+